MMPYDLGIAYMQRMAVDYSADTLIFLKMLYNNGYLKILSEFGRQPIELTTNFSLTANLRNYQNELPVNMGTPVDLEMVDGTTIQPLFEVADNKRWSLMKSGAVTGRPTHFHYRPSFGVGGGILELYPIPSSSTYQINMVYEAIDRELSHLKYTAGTVTLGNNNVAVTGATTVFTSDMVGRYLHPTGDGQDRQYYYISAFTSATSLTLQHKYGGTGGASLAYEIVEIPNLPIEMQKMPADYALWHHYSSKGNAPKTKEFKDYFEIDMAKAKKTHSLVVRDGTIDMGDASGVSSIFEPYPANFPNSVT